MDNMKTSIKYIAMAGPLFLLLATGCQREVFVEGDGEVLTVRIADEAFPTRTSFTNYDGMFQWDDNDQIKVHYADRGFETMTIDVDGEDPTVGTILSSTAGSKLRDFFAVFPASSAVDPNNGDTAPKVKLPSGYDISGIVAGTSSLTTNHVPTPMVAKNIPGEDLQFHHVGGLLRINLKSVDSATKRVRVTFDRGVTGTFPVNVDNPAQPYINNTAVSGGNNIVTFDVASSASGVGSGVTTILLNIPVPCGTYGEVIVEALGNGGNILFTHTHSEPELVFERAHGKRLAADEIILDFNLEMGSYLTEHSFSYQGGSVELVHGVKSYKEREGTIIPEPIHLEYSETGTEGTWSTTAPDWLSLGAGSDLQGGEAGSTVNLAVAPQKNVVDPKDDPHTKALSEKSSVEIDLSKINVATGKPLASATTANCYVVQAPGTYTFPVVYGNAVKNGEPYTDSYKVNLTQVSEGDYTDDNGVIWMRNYRDHLNEHIETPYIAKQLKAKGLGIGGVKLLWRDAPDATGLIKNVTYHHGDTEEEDYISFEVDANDICQGNAVIAVFDNQNRVAWSWHIWVTDADLTAFNRGHDDLCYSQINLGWCDQKDVAKYPARTYYVRIAQDDPDGEVSRAIKIETAEGPNISYFGNSPYYQGDRKDPLIAWKGIGTERKEYWAAEGYYPEAGGYAENPTMADYIQNPHLHYRTTIPYGNGWDSNHNTSGITGTKTVYDPSPVGFKLPQNNTTKKVFYAIGEEEWDAANHHYFCLDQNPDEDQRKMQFFPGLGRIDNAGGFDMLGIECHYWYSGGLGMWGGEVTGNRFTLYPNHDFKHHGATIPQGLSVRPMFEVSPLENSGD